MEPPKNQPSIQGEWQYKDTSLKISHENKTDYIQKTDVNEKTRIFVAKNIFSTIKYVLLKNFGKDWKEIEVTDKNITLTTNNEGQLETTRKMKILVNKTWFTNISQQKNPSLPNLLSLKLENPKGGEEPSEHIKKIKSSFGDLELEKKNYTFENATNDINSNKNRYKNILSNDKANFSPEDPLSDNDKPLNPNYFNADKISLTLNNEKFNYVATQAPLEHTLNDFFLAALSGKITTIVNLANPIENGKSKAFDYWSDSFWTEGQKIEIKDGNIHLGDLKRVSQTSEKDGLLKTTFEFTNKVGIKSTIEHLFYSKWPDFGVPEGDDLESLENLLDIVKDKTKPNEPPKVMVHCSAGVGRTGAFIASDFARRQVDQQLGQKKDKADIQFDAYPIVNEMRDGRAGAVQTDEQYLLIYQLAQRYTRNK